MKQHFSQYPSQRMWELKSTDSNIDHRRIPNLKKFFERNGKSIPLSKNAEDYKAGDIISWRLDNGLPHISIVIDQKYNNGKRP